MTSKWARGRYTDLGAVAAQLCFKREDLRPLVHSFRKVPKTGARAAWTKNVVRFLAVKSQFILAGNIRDFYACSVNLAMHGDANVPRFAPV